MQQRQQRWEGDALSHRQEHAVGAASTQPNRSVSGLERLFALPINRAQPAPSTTTSTRPRRGEEEYIPPPQRSTKAKNLQEEFETLKRKIREVENKNERILEKIHSTQEQERKRSLERRPMPIFDTETHNDQPVSETYARGRSNFHTEVEHQRQQSKLRFPSKSYLRTSVGDLPVRAHSRSNIVEDDRLKRDRQERHVTELKALVKELQGKSMELQASLDKERMQRESLASQLLLVEDQLKKEHLRLETVKSSFRSYGEYARQIFQNSLDRFMDLLLNKLLQIDKKNKRNFERLEALARQTRRYLENRSVQRIQQLPEFSSLAAKDQTMLLERNKSREFENIVAKYEQMIRSKNEEYEGLQSRFRAKEREQQEVKQSVERLKEEKRRLSLSSEQRLTEVESALTTLQNENRALKEELRNAVQRQPAPSQESTSRISVRSTGSEFREQQQHEEQLIDLQMKVSFYEKAIIDKNNLVIALERDLLNSKGKCTELFNEYQDSLQRIKQTTKQRTDELTAAQTDLKTQLLLKEQQLLDVQQNQRALEQQLVELQIDYDSLRDRLELKQRLPKQQLKPSTDEDLLELQPKTPTSQQSRSVSIGNELTVEGTRQLQAKLDQLSRENRSLQVEMIHEKSQAQMARTYKLEMDRLDVHCKELEGRVHQLTEQIEDLNRHFNDPSDLSISMGSTVRSMRKESSRDHGAAASNAVELQLLQVEADNMRLNSELITFKKDLELSERMKEQFSNRARELKVYVEQLEKNNTELQQATSQKLKELEGSKSVLEMRVRTLTDEKQALESELHTHQLTLKEHAKRKSDHIRRTSDDNRLKDVEIERLTTRLKDLQQELRQKDLLERKLNEQHRGVLAGLKQELEQAKVNQLRQAEVCKLQEQKIRGLESEANTNRLNEHAHTTSSHLRAQSEKIKHLESQLLEAKLEKATLEAHLRTSEENNSRLMHQTSEMIAQLEAKKHELARLAVIYEERLAEQEVILRNYEKQRRPSREEIEDSRRKSDLKSHVSGSGELQSEQVLPDQPNIEQLFETNEYTKLQPRRKDLCKLLEATGDYIRKLKQVVKEKNKKIRVLEKRIEELRSSPHKFHRSTSYNVHTQGEEVVESAGEEDSIRDNYSVKMENRRGCKQRKLRQLENETHLIIEENHLLLQQVQNLQDELTRAEQQENGLVRMKEVYKKEITHLRGLLDERENQLKLLRRQLDGVPRPSPR